MALSNHPPRAESFSAFLHLLDRHEESWDRFRVWGPMQTLLGIFALVEPGRRTSYQSACETTHAWAGVRFEWNPDRAPDPAGFKRARDRVTEETCAEVLSDARHLARSSIRSRDKRRLGGRPVVAFDGSTLHMPRVPETVMKYGVPKNKLGQETCHYPQARLMTAWDLDSRTPLAWDLGSLGTGERAMAITILDQIPDEAVCVFDRGFPSREFFGEVLDSRRHIVARMISSEAVAWTEVADFLASGKRDAIVPVWVGSGPRRRQVRFRLVLRTFDRGRPFKYQNRKSMVVITSLIHEPMTARDLCRLYGERWGIETLYRELKAVAEIERWHGRSIELIRQEVILLLVWFCFAAIIAAAAVHARLRQGKKRGAWRPNTRRIFSAIARIMEALLAGKMDEGIVAELIRRANAAIISVIRWMLKQRLGRCYRRKPLHPYARTL